MALIDQLKRDHEDLLEALALLSQKINEMRRAAIIEPASHIRFQLDDLMKVDAKRYADIVAEIERLGEKIANLKRMAGRPRPQSDAYEDACEYIDKALIKPPRSQRRDDKLDEIECSLQWAVDHEAGNEAPELMRCYLRFEQARVYYLRGKYKDACDLFKEVRNHLNATRDDDLLLREAEEFLDIIDLHAEVGSPVGMSRRDLVVRARNITEQLMQMSNLVRNPTACMLYHELRLISQAQENQVAAEVLGSRMADYQGGARAAGTGFPFDPDQPIIPRPDDRGDK
jgi:tetratricopeptide (TPR) repeat protein